MSLICLSVALRFDTHTAAAAGLLQRTEVLVPGIAATVHDPTQPTVLRRLSGFNYINSNRLTVHKRASSEVDS